MCCMFSTPTCYKSPKGGGYKQVKLVCLLSANYQPQEQ